VPLLVSVHKADSNKVHMHGKDRDWVFLVVEGPSTRFLRLNPMTEELEITSLADASTRFLATLEPIGAKVTFIDLHGTAMQMHQTFLPTLSANSVTEEPTGAIKVRPVGVPA
jgi:hypothetical protein